MIIRLLLLTLFITVTSLQGADVESITPSVSPAFGRCIKLSGITIQESHKTNAKGETDPIITFLTALVGTGAAAQRVTIRLSGFTKDIDDRLRGKDLNGMAVELIGYERVEMRGFPSGANSFPEVANLVLADMDWYNEHIFVVMAITSTVKPTPPPPSK